MKTWIKLYTEVVHDRKLWKLKPIEQLSFFYMLALAGIEDDGGMLPEKEDIELELQMPLKLKKGELDGIVSRLVSVGLLEEHPLGRLKVSQFEKRQMSNQTEAERKAAYRDRKKTLSGQMSQKCPDTCPDNVPEMSTIEEEVEVEEELIKHTIGDGPKKSAKEVKQKFGQFNNVMLTPTEYAKLCERFPDADGRIEHFSVQKQAKGYKYDSDYAAILSWANKDAKKALTEPKTAQPKKTYTFAEVLAMEEAGQL